MNGYNSIQRAADLAADGLRAGEGGLAVYKAAQLYGLTTAAVSRELADRRKAKKAAKERALKGTGNEYYRKED